MDIFATYATDDTKEEEGVVVFLNDGADPAKDPWIKVARINNTAYAEGVTSGYEKIQAEKKLQKLDKKAIEIRSKNMMTELMADTILKGFGNLTFQGKPLTYSRESALMTLRVKDFREMVYAKASDFELFRAEYVEAAAGN